MGKQGKQVDAAAGPSHPPAEASSSSYDLGTYPPVELYAASPEKAVRQRTRTRTIEGSRNGDEGDDEDAHPLSKTYDDELTDDDIPRARRSTAIPRPPSFAQSQFATIVRRQRKRRLFTPHDDEHHAGSDGQHHHHADVERGWQGSTLKVGRSRTEGPARAAPLNDYDFAGWGSMAMLDITEDQWKRAEHRLRQRRNRPRLGQLRAMAIAGNAVTGSIFYALPSVFAVAGVWTPVCLVLAALLMIPTLIVIYALAQTLSCGSNAASYSYILNVCSSRTLALVAGAITLLDAVSTGAVSASTAASYASSEAGQRLSGTAFTLIFLVALTAVGLLGLRDSSTTALSIYSFHNAAMVALLVAGCIAWGRQGSAILIDNWVSPSPDGKSTARALFDGTVVAFVGLTGFETTVSYAASVASGSFSKALRNIWLSVALLEAPMALLVLAVIPLKQIQSSNDVLALLASVAGGKGLHVYITVDAAIVLCGGVLTGAISCAGLLLAMCADGTLPRWLAGTLKRTGAPVWCLIAYLGLCIIVCATAGFDQLTLSSIFSLAFLAVLTLFGLSSLLAFHSRPLLFSARSTSRPLSPRMVLLSLCITIIALAGNVALSPLALAQAAAYAGVIAVLLLSWANRVPLLHFIGVWAPSVLFSDGVVNTGNGHDADDGELVVRKASKDSRGVAGWIVRRSKAWVARQRRENRAIFLTSTDSLPHLLQALLYLSRNEPSVGHLTLAHCYRSVDAIPAELEANHQLVDEAFPHITVDLVFFDGARSRRGARTGEDAEEMMVEDGESQEKGGWGAEALEALIIAMSEAEQAVQTGGGTATVGDDVSGQPSAASPTISAVEAKIRSRVFIGCPSPSPAGGANLLSDVGEGVRIILD